MGTLGYAILGLLARRPHTGYELARAMDRPIGYMWAARHSQIYPELASLEREGLIRHRVVDGPGPRDTKRYSITATGRSALRSWVDAPLAPEASRWQLMLRIWSLWLLSPERAAAFVARVRADRADRLATYRIEEEQFYVEGDPLADPAAPAFAGFATLRWGLAYEEALIVWLDWLLEQVTRKKSSHVAKSDGPGV
jgi:DNA-binding PadR family transcriptional regulator